MFRAILPPKGKGGRVVRTKQSQHRGVRIWGPRDALDAPTTMPGILDTLFGRKQLKEAAGERKKSPVSDQATGENFKRLKKQADEAAARSLPPPLAAPAVRPKAKATKDTESYEYDWRHRK